MKPCSPVGRNQYCAECKAFSPKPLLIASNLHKLGDKVLTSMQSVVPNGLVATLIPLFLQLKNI